MLLLIMIVMWMFVLVSSVSGVPVITGRRFCGAKLVASTVSSCILTKCWTMI